MKSEEFHGLLSIFAVSALRVVVWSGSFVGVVMATDPVTVARIDLREGERLLSKEALLRLEGAD